MMQDEEIPTARLIKTLRRLVDDLCSDDSPFNKDRDYLRNLAGWVACAASRLSELNE